MEFIKKRVNQHMVENKHKYRNAVRPWDYVTSRARILGGSMTS